MGRILLTGVSGFVGKALAESLVRDGKVVRGTVRSLDSYPSFLSDLTGESFELAESGDICSSTDWTGLVHDVDCVIHCAARAHVMHESEKDALSAYRRVNLDGTLQLARQAAEAGVRRIIYLSSIKVNGEGTGYSTGGSECSAMDAYSHTDPPAPEDAYGLSKWEAEQAIWQISEKTGLEAVIVRLPLVYGAGVKGNLERLINLVKAGIPLPLAGIENKRSMICLANLTDFLGLCIDHPAAAGETFLISDNEDLSTEALLRLIAKAMNVDARLFSFPPLLFQVAGNLFAKKHELDRLLGSLRVDSRYARETLNWTPLATIDDEIMEMVNHHLKQNSDRV